MNFIFVIFNPYRKKTVKSIISFQQKNTISFRIKVDNSDHISPCHVTQFCEPIRTWRDNHFEIRPFPCIKQWMENRFEIRPFSFHLFICAETYEWNCSFFASLVSYNVLQHMSETRVETHMLENIIPFSSYVLQH